MENIEGNNIQNNKSTDKTSKILIASVAILAVAVIVLSILLVLKQKRVVIIEKEKTEVTDEKERLKEELSTLLDDYDELETNNDSLNSQIEREKEHIETLIEEIDKMKSYSYSMKKKYENEIVSLKKIMRGYVYQIDSLDQLNKQLIVENTKIKDDKEQTEKELQVTLEHNDELSSVIESASVLKTASIVTKFLTESNRETRRVRRIEKLEVSFILVANDLAQAGAKRIYLRIIGPDDFVMTDGGSFTFREKNIAYSAYRDVSYEKENLPVSIFYSLKERLKEGKYTIELYLNGENIGKSSFTIE